MLSAKKLKTMRARLRCTRCIMLKVSPAMAAGVTDRLLGMTNVVDVLDAFEAKQKRVPKVTVEVDEWKITGGYYVRGGAGRWHA
jgi:hypothetical protein